MMTSTFSPADRARSLAILDQQGSVLVSRSACGYERLRDRENARGQTTDDTRDATWPRAAKEGKQLATRLPSMRQGRRVARTPARRDRPSQPQLDDLRHRKSSACLRSRTTPMRRSGLNRAARRRRCAQYYFALSSVLERRGMRAHGTTGNEGHWDPQSTPVAIA
jgi:hypothetical protein